MKALFTASICCGLAACGTLTGNLKADGPQLFQDACFAVTTADGMFQSASPALVASGRLTQNQIAQERAIFTVDATQCAHPPVDASGNVDYAQLAISLTADAGAIYLILSPVQPGTAAAAAIHR